MDTPPSHWSHYRRITGHAKWLAVLLALTIPLDVVDMAIVLHQNHLLKEELPDTDAIDLDDLLTGIVAIPAAIVYLTIIILFIKWLRRAYRNTRVLGARKPRFGSHWTIIGWFVPFIALWRPKQIVDDTWRASDPDAPEDQGSGWRDARVPGWIAGWWAAFLISGFVGRAVTRGAFQSNPTVDDIINLNNINAVSDVLDAVSAVLAIVVVRRLTRRQDLRAERFGIAQGAVVVTPAAPTIS